MESYISFPKLGLEFPFDDTAFQLGSLTVKWYGIIICLGFLLCTLLGLRSCRKFDIEGDDLLDYLLFAMPSAVLGARLYYVIFNWNLYAEEPIRMLYFWEGGLAIYGGVLAAVLCVAIVAKVKKQSFLQIVDFAMPYIILGQAIGRWGNFFNQEAYGSVTTLPWGMSGSEISVVMAQQGMYGGLVHPTFLYESLWCLAGFAFLLVYRNRWQKNRGEVLSLYMIIYGLGRSFIEGLRTDSLMWGGFRVSQVLSVILVLLGICLLVDCRRRWKTAVYEAGEAGEAEAKLARVIREMEGDTESSETVAAEAAVVEAAALETDALAVETEE